MIKTLLQYLLFYTVKPINPEGLPLVQLNEQRGPSTKLFSIQQKFKVSQIFTTLQSNNGNKLQFSVGGMAWHQ